MIENYSIDILIVEDNPCDLELALDALRRNNLANHIQVARDGVEALDFIFCTGEFKDRLSPTQPKIVLLDLKLPRVDGLEVLRQIRSDPRTHAIPVVVMTSSREEADIAQSYNLGVNSYIVKPVDFANFSAAVRQLGFYWLLLNQSPNPQM